MQRGISAPGITCWGRRAATPALTWGAPRVWTAAPSSRAGGGQGQRAGRGEGVGPECQPCWQNAGLHGGCAAPHTGALGPCTEKGGGRGKRGTVCQLDAVGPSHECPHGRTLLGCARDSWGLEAVVRPPRMGSWLGRPNIVPLLARVSDRAPHVMLTVGVPKDGPTSSFPGTGAPCCALSDVCCRQDVE